jgi:radical SAM protein with 4Fe4S-binding SPASM domain
MARPGNLVALHEYLFDLGFNDIWVQAVYDQKGMVSRGDAYEHRALLHWYRALMLAGVVIRVNPIDRFLEGLMKRRSALSSWYPCGAGLFLLGVDPGGRMSPCHHFLEESEYSLGHVSDGIPSMDKRAHLSAKVSDRSPCHQCWARHLCGGECYHRALTVSHDYDGTIEPVCDERRDLIRETLEVFLDLEERRPNVLDDLLAGRLTLPAPNPKAYRARDLSAYTR